MRSILAIAGCALLLVSSCSKQEAPKSTPPPDAQRVDAARAGTVTGRVTIEGPVPANAPIKMGGDRVCTDAHKDGAMAETFVSENGGLGNVFVYIKDGLGKYYFDPPAAPVRLDQRGCQYQPHVFGVQVGQNVEFVNSDATGHNVHALPNTNQEFNFSQFIQKQTDTKFFTAPEVMIRFKCDMHNWMSAYGGVLPHPYFAVTPAAGVFELKNVPAGTYTLEAWHEKLGTTTQQITLGEKESKAITFSFKAPTVSPVP
jgi:plastocyanin